MSDPTREPSTAIARARTLLDDVRGRALSAAQRAATASELAAYLHTEALRSESRAERRRREQLARMMKDPAGQAFTTCLTDRAHRSRDPARVVDAARGLLRTLGAPAYLPDAARMQLGLLLHAGPFAPVLAARGLLHRLHRESAHVVLPAEHPALRDALARFAARGVRVNLNHLGEAVLGEPEAARRIASYVAFLAQPEVEHVSIKLSSIASRLDLFAYEATLARVRARLATLYRAALAQRRPDGRPKLVSLDMEGYRDLALSVAAFRAALDEPDLLPLGAGLALQAYVPESITYEAELLEWAGRRVERGGAPIHLRLVKGANLLAERCEASLRGWPLPLHPDKAAVDAAFKRMVEHACRPEHLRAAHVGIASHNVFDLAYALVLRAERQLEGGVGFELIAGMADPLVRALRALVDDVLVYAPVVDADAMHTAIAYLVRRLDEGTSPGNFLSRAPSLRVGDAAWEEERERFETACRDAIDGNAPPHAEPAAPSAATGATFANAADTDVSRPEARARFGAALARAAALAGAEIESRIAGSTARRTWIDGFDPSRPGVVPYRIALADAADVERALAAATAAAPRWASTSAAERAALLRAVADGLSEARADLVAAMVLDAGKRVEEGDTEVSEAVDLARYYAACLDEFESLRHVELRPHGVVLVAPPWNFPLAIPGGGAFAALAAGNTVVLKPALETPLVAARLHDVCRRAGVPDDVLQLVLCEDEIGSRLVVDSRVDAVVLTGGTATARLFLDLRPSLRLFAETGGKNAMIASASCDRDLAIADVLRSAFGHAGQKCSAASLFVLEQEIHDDARFLDALREATASLPVGSAWDPESVVTPLIRPPAEALRRGLTVLDHGETWLVEPRPSADNPRLWSPGIKLGVAPGSFTHRTELFGPVLAVMRANDLDHAVEIANATPYGLTAGLHALDEREQARWMARMEAGNLYVNRGITGAVVQRQPFGGFKASSFGPGAKAGGPSYVLQMAHAIERGRPEVTRPPAPDAADLVTRVRPHLHERQRERLSAGACDYARAWHERLALEHDPSGVVGERNVLRYLACDPLLVRAADDADVVDVLLACAAALTAGARVTVSLSEALVTAHPHLRSVILDARVEDARACAVEGMARVRAVGRVEAPILQAARSAGVHVAADPVVTTGRIELLRVCREQAISLRWHRYGSLAGEALLPLGGRAVPTASGLSRRPGSPRAPR